MKRFPSRMFALALVFGVNAHAAVFTVGTPSGVGQPCAYGTIQSAINAANNSAGTDTVRITRSLTYEPEAITINTAQELTIEGGYATCDQKGADTTNTVISGTGGAHAPVFNITAPTGAFIHMHRLQISGGDVDGGGTGGGIRFVGDGVLELVDSLVTQNTAGNGGGIYAEGNGSHTELVIGTNVVISNNTARYSGGGVMSRGVELSMLDTKSSILLNHALGTGGSGGYGGGLYVYAYDRPSYAYIGSGAPVFGAFYDNDALYGGGVAIVSAGSDAAELQLYATDASYQTKVYFNSASQKGGGIYVSSPKAKATLWNAVLDSNDAPNGGAAYIASDSGLHVNIDDLPAAAVPCTIGVDCGRIVNNTADTGSNPGSIVYAENGTYLQIGYPSTLAPSDARGGVLIQNNSAGSVFGGAGHTQIFRSLVSGNTTSSNVIQQSDYALDIYDSTIAGNTIGGGSAIILASSSVVTIERSILWQPGSTSMVRSGGSFQGAYTVASENISLDFDATVFDPRFVDPAHGDFGLRAGSRAVDFAPSGFPPSDRDALGRKRNVDLANYDSPGPRDAGAFERPSVQPLVLNADVDIDLRLWDVVTSGTSTRDSTLNASGPSNSGSVHITRTNVSAGDETRGLSQCIHLPANGTYALNGWGRGTGSNLIAGDKAELYWEYRTNGGENCDQGAVYASGTLALSAKASWSRPAQPVLIPVNQLFSGYSPSIKIYLVAREKGSVVGQGMPNSVTALTTDAWFDGITLDYVGDRIFADDFE